MTKTRTEAAETEPGCTHPECVLSHPHPGPAVLGGRYLARQSFMHEIGDFIGGFFYRIEHHLAQPLVDAGMLERHEE